MLKVNEIFGPTIQGEGKSAGMKVLFLRLANCNLHCHWCDTPYTWNWYGTKWTHPLKFDPKIEIQEMSTQEVLEELLKLSQNSVHALVISGGEPLLQWKELTTLCAILKQKGWWIEIETNGTIAPASFLDSAIGQYNCSPKLSNSGDTEKLRIRAKALEALVANQKVFFKFVIASNADIQEVLEYVKTYKMPPERVYLMPLGMTPKELTQTREMTQKLAELFGFKFSDRLHVVRFGGIRGV